jgi:predicted metal-dependent hydrolase
MKDAGLKTKAKSARGPLSKPQRALLALDGQSVEVLLRLNPRARRLIVKVHPSTGEVTVVAPSRAALTRALDFARGESAWIARQLSSVPSRISLSAGARIPFRGEEHVIRSGEAHGEGPVWLEKGGDLPVIRVSGRSEHVPRRLTDFLKRQAKEVLEERAFEYAARIGVKHTRITVRDTASRWGSCSSARSLSFSWRLILAPPFVLDYVVAHEVAHIREMNHGRNFWKLVSQLVGNPDAAQKWLREHGMALHRYAAKV